jgi:hypothetical protein
VSIRAYNVLPLGDSYKHLSVFGVQDRNELVNYCANNTP